MGMSLIFVNNIFINYKYTLIFIKYICIPYNDLYWYTFLELKTLFNKKKR